MWVEPDPMPGAEGTWPQVYRMLAMLYGWTFNQIGSHTHEQIADAIEDKSSGVDIPPIVIQRYLERQRRAAKRGTE